MTDELKLIVFVISIIFGIVVYIFIKKQHLSAGFAAVWLAGIFFALLTVLFGESFLVAYAWLRSADETNPNLLLLFPIGFIFIILIFFTVKLSRMSTQLRSLIQLTSVNNFENQESEEND